MPTHVQETQLAELRWALRNARVQDTGGYSGLHVEIPRATSGLLLRSYLSKRVLIRKCRNDRCGRTYL